MRHPQGLLNAKAQLTAGAYLARAFPLVSVFQDQTAIVVMCVLVSL